MILTLEETKLWLRVDHDEEDVVIEMLIAAAEQYLYNAAGRVFDDRNRIARLFCLVLVTDWFENRELVGARSSDKVRFTVQSMLAQLQYAPAAPGEGVITDGNEANEIV